MLKTQIWHQFIFSYIPIVHEHHFPQICFWLLENKLRVMIAACDTFRAGAVEQLRTHVRKLNSLHPPEQANGLPSVMLYERGYGKDAASIAMDAINFGEYGW
jgi:signal recognition particle receptor subunit alpha